MAKREAVALNESVPQLQVPQTGDTYQFVRDVFLTTGIIKSEVADGASAVGVVLDTENSFANSTAKLLSVRNGGVEKFFIGPTGKLRTAGYFGGGGIEFDSASNSLGFISNAIYMEVGSALRFAVSSGNFAQFTQSHELHWPAANVLEMRYSTNPQAFRVCNTYTNDSNYERARLAWSGNVLYLGTEAAGTGTKRNLVLDSANRAAYDASPSATVIRDILISFGMMAAS
jgi:hypothetical protein